MTLPIRTHTFTADPNDPRAKLTRSSQRDDINTGADVSVATDGGPFHPLRGDDLPTLASLARAKARYYRHERGKSRVARRYDDLADRALEAFNGRFDDDSDHDSN